MSRLTPMFILLVVAVIAIDACSSRDQNCHGGGCTQHRRRRAASDTLQNALTEFDIRLTEEMSSEIQDMSPEEKQSFINDLSKLNEAVKREISSVDKSARFTEQFLPQLADKLSQDFSGKKWFKRLRAIAGDKISQLINGEQGNE